MRASAGACACRLGARVARLVAQLEAVGRPEHSPETPFLSVIGQSCLTRVLATPPPITPPGTSPLAGTVLHTSRVPDDSTFGPGVPRACPVPDWIRDSPDFAELLGYFMGDGTAYVSSGGARLALRSASYGEVERYGRLLAAFFPGLVFTLGRISKAHTDKPGDLTGANTRQGQYDVTARAPTRAERRLILNGGDPTGRLSLGASQALVDMMQRLAPTVPLAHLVKLGVCRETLRPFKLPEGVAEKVKKECDWWYLGREPSVQVLGELFCAWTYDKHGNRVYPVEFLEGPFPSLLSLWHGLWVADGFKSTRGILQKSLVSAWHISLLWDCLGAPDVSMEGDGRGVQDVHLGHYYNENIFVLRPLSSDPGRQAAGVVVKAYTGYVDLPNSLRRLLNITGADGKVHGSIEVYRVQTASGFVTLGVSSGGARDGPAAAADAAPAADAPRYTVAPTDAAPTDAPAPTDSLVQDLRRALTAASNDADADTATSIVRRALAAVAVMSDDDASALLWALADALPSGDQDKLRCVVLAAVARLYAVWSMDDAPETLDALLRGGVLSTPREDHHELEDYDALEAFAPVVKALDARIAAYPYWPKNGKIAIEKLKSVPLDHGESSSFLPRRAVLCSECGRQWGHEHARVQHRSVRTIEPGSSVHSFRTWDVCPFRFKSAPNSRTMHELAHGRGRSGFRKGASHHLFSE